MNREMMAKRCSKCGAEIGEDWPVCRSCFEPVKREGLFRRLLRYLGARVNLSVNINLKETIKIRDPVTGELREYHSLDDVPPDYREKIRKLREQSETTQGVQRVEKI